ncbi:hypothetical protein OMAG_000405 [Candidatus Omnitrophus magneticus]|uniref:Uncharacterized protein n=1 Tax=Candidatus Omnitrophus magneticus TaxID=1609969 RepID=A0A0F0CQZ7_9BACT|nr:hypothetical protein OMAG_000405 [Candidatus Omnitrophus magneticus]
MEKKLCKLANKEYLKNNMKEYLELVVNAAYVCGKCGRVAKEEKYLCKPKNIHK